jgi:hypothetical protein
MAGSVGARTAPTRKPVTNETSKAADATAPTTSAVRTTPGTARSVNPIPMGERIANATPRPP